MNRRRVLRGLMAGAAVSGFRLPAVAAEDYAGRFFVFVQADGGWDPTSFCDPKTNTKGEREINRWARKGEVQQAGRLRYAPFADNKAFFKKHHRRMLVINGVDAQTNSHTVGVTHNWSGRNAEGFPTLTSLLAAHKAAEKPLTYLSFGGFAATQGVTRYTRVTDVGKLKQLASPNADHDLQGSIHFPDDWRAVLAYRARRLSRLNEAAGLLPRPARNRDYYQRSLAPQGVEILKRFAAALPPPQDLEHGDQYSYADYPAVWNNLRPQAQIAVLAFKTGAAISADLHIDGFDTHRYNDPVQGWLLAALTDGVDFLWDYAEQHGIADRLVVVIGSDFGRTNFYNAEDGKDHWPIGSYIVMENNQPWTNRAVGETDALHFAQKINPKTLKRDDKKGTLIYPKHVHKALRRYLGVEDSPYAKRFPFNNTEDFAFFG